MFQINQLPHHMKTSFLPRVDQPLVSPNSRNQKCELENYGVYTDCQNLRCVYEEI